MGIRRRRRKLTTLMSRLDQRVRSVELRPISLLTAAQVAAAIEDGALEERPDVLVSGAAPYEWTRVQDAYYYPAKLTSNSEDRVEIYVEASLDRLDVGGRLAVSGIHGTSTFNIDVDSDNFTVLFVDAVDGGGVWEDRASWKHNPTQNQLPGVTITNTYSFKPETLGPVTWTTRQPLQTKRKVDSFEITGSTVTLTMNADHKFKVGNVMFINILSDQASNDESRVAAGIDGLFYITAVTSNTIKYELAAGVDEPTGTITPAADVYVFPVARRWAQDGSIWVNNSDNTTYYWDGIRWTEYTPTAEISQDDDPPSPPTGLTIESDIVLPRNVVELTANWTAPTTSESGAALTDLAAHEIQWRASSNAQWDTQRVPINLGNTYTFTSDVFARQQAYSFRIFAVDSGGNFSSTAATATHTTAGSATQTNIGAVRPTPPAIETYLGTFTITWNGQVEDISNQIQDNPPGVSTLYVHASTNDGFTPSDATRVGILAAGPNQKFVYAPDFYGRTFYFRLEIEDLAGSGSLFSRQITGTGAQSVDVQEIANIIAAADITPGTIVTGQDIIGLNITGNVIKGNEIHGNVIRANTLEADRIVAGAISSKLISGDVITTSETDSGSRIRITKDYLEAYNGTTLNFRLHASNGHVFIGESVQIGGGYATTNDLAGYATTGSLGNYLTTSSAANTYAALSSLGLYLTASDASNTYVTALSAGELFLDKSTYLTPNSTRIDGGQITTGTVLANAIGSGTLPVNVIYAGTLNANNITTGTLTGRTIQTATAAPNVTLTASDQSAFFNQLRFNTFINNSSRLSGSIRDIGGIFQVGGQDINYYMQWLGSTWTVRSAGFSDGKIRIDSTAFTVFGTCRVPATKNASNSVNYVYSSTSNGQLIAGATVDLGGSDIALKKDVENESSGLSVIEKLRPVSFRYNNENDAGSKRYGLIAQELEEVLATYAPKFKNILVEDIDSSFYEEHLLGSKEDQPKVKAVNYEKLTMFLISAVQELSDRVKTLEKEAGDAVN